MFHCLLCSDEWMLVSNHCAECIQISRIVKLMGRTKCLNILKTSCFNKEHIEDLIQLTDIDQSVEEKNITEHKSYADVLKDLGQTQC